MLRGVRDAKDDFHFWIEASQTVSLEVLLHVKHSLVHTLLNVGIGAEPRPATVAVRASLATLVPRAALEIVLI